MPALDDFRVSLPSAQSESEKVVNSSTILPLQHATCVCCVELGPAAPALFPSRHALLVFVRNCLARARGLSRARRHVWDRADTQFLALSQCNLLFNALMLSVDP